MKLVIQLNSRAKAKLSPSVWRVWIEICLLYLNGIRGIRSPSVWRVWIEIKSPLVSSAGSGVTLRVEGVD